MANDGRMEKPLSTLEAFARLNAAVWRLGASLVRAFGGSGDHQEQRAAEADARADELRRRVTDDD